MPSRYPFRVLAARLIRARQAAEVRLERVRSTLSTHQQLLQEAEGRLDAQRQTARHAAEQSHPTNRVTWGDEWRRFEMYDRALRVRGAHLKQAVETQRQEVQRASTAVMGAREKLTAIWASCGAVQRHHQTWIGIQRAERRRREEAEGEECASLQWSRRKCDSS